MKKIIFLALLAMLLCSIIVFVQRDEDYTNSMLEVHQSISTTQFATPAPVTRSDVKKKEDAIIQKEENEDQIEITEDARDSEINETQFDKDTSDIESYHQDADRKKDDLQEAYKNNGLELIYHKN